MNTIDIIRLLNSKLFHDLGNSITTLSLLSDSKPGFDGQTKIIDEFIARFKLLRQTFVEVDSEICLLSCYELLAQHFSSKKIYIRDFRANVSKEFSADQCQLLINLVMCLATSISYDGYISLSFNDNGFELKANGNSSINHSIEEILNNNPNTKELSTNNIQVYFVTLLADYIKSKIECSHNDNTVIVNVMFLI